jgi:hypothetical protein
MRNSLVLSGDLNFGELKIVQNGNFAEISIASSGQIIASLNGIQARAIGVEDFEFLPILYKPVLDF